ncbi:trypsin-like serine protease [Actinosynnema sp. NPDC047251]|uniref:Peptidase S1 domain-containing protein n=1 Tax=Saccharothrix espanaensis (strain ATCC 51144 / DSM 44229 / JCM 9112 / NBRC 15066 / NRRL 15764) TaxID=1179773 RepID=K0JZF3_SACES|nr:trypsin-like serine protease [Saccharothrix espanaensis]CCH31491.1 hypothetical protein BN6_42040 [Saccharothrix espanaensis DSM 44229]
MRRIGSALLALVALFATAGNAAADPRIIGGRAATTAYSFMVALSNGCGASLVSPTWLVTATHCGAAGSARIGSLRNDSGGEVIRIDRKVDRAGTDLTMMRLAKASTKTPVKRAPGWPSVGSSVRLLGWGCTSWPDCVTPVALQEIDLIALAYDECGGAGPKDVCVSGDKAHSACHGDSGGPAVVWYQEEWQLVGETHGAGDWDAECAGTTLYTGTHQHKAWIDTQLAS